MIPRNWSHRSSNIFKFLKCISVSTYTYNTYLYLFYGIIFRITFEEVNYKNQNKNGEKVEVPCDKKVIVVEPHVPPSRGPYLYNEPKKYV